MKHKITPDISFTILLMLSLLSHFIYPIAKIIVFPYTLTGLIFIAMGIILASISNTILIKHNTSIQPFEEANTLIITGPFKYSRNPVYSGMILILSGIEIFLGSLSAFIFPVIFIIFLNKIVREEERRLEKTFGEEYLKYKNRVGRWL